MAPLVVLVSVWLLGRGAGFFGFEPLRSWTASARLGLLAMFLFTGLTHFSPMRHDFAAMIPPPLPRAMWLIYFTGLAQLLLAAGLMIGGARKWAGVALMVLLAGLFPANLYAALNGIPFGGRPPTPLPLRTAIQAFFIFLVWWSSVRAAVDAK